MKPFPREAQQDRVLQGEVGGHSHALYPLSSFCPCNACICWRAGKVFRAYAPWPLEEAK